MRLLEFFPKINPRKSNIRLTETQIVVYHGSGENEPIFAHTHTGKNSTIFGAYDVSRIGTFFSNNPQFSALYGRVGKYQIDIQNVLEEEMILEQLFRFNMTLDAHGPERDFWIEVINITRHGRPWQAFDNPIGERFVPYLIEQGYDSARFEEYNRHVIEPSGVEVELESITTVVFDPSRIRRLSAHVVVPITESEQYSPVLTADQIEDMVRSHHHTENDFDDGDLLKRIHDFSKYHFRWMDPNEIRMGQWHVDQDRKDQYVAKLKSGSMIPPIVIQNSWHIIIDGTHRHDAAVEAGIKQIPVYVGLDADAVPDEDNPYADVTENYDAEYGYYRESVQRITEMPGWMDEYPDHAKDMTTDINQLEGLKLVTVISDIDVYSVFHKFTRTIYYKFILHGKPITSEMSVGFLDLIEYKRNSDEWSVWNIYTDPSIRGSGFATAMYEYLLSTGITLVAGSTLNPDSSRLWTRLFKNPNIRVWGMRWDGDGKPLSLKIGTDGRLTPEREKYGFKDVMFKALMRENMTVAETRIDNAGDYPYTASNVGGVGKPMSDTKTVYHCTLATNLRTIMVQGLEPRIGKNSKAIKEKQPGVHIFFDWASMEDAVANWEMDWHEDDEAELVALTLEVPADWVRSHWETFNTGTGIILRNIPPSMIVAIKRNF